MTPGEKMIWANVFAEQARISRADYPHRSDDDHFEAAASFATNYVTRVRMSACALVDRMGTPDSGMLLDMLGGELAEREADS